MNKWIRVAIDGPSGAGKSTMARRVAKDLGFLYVDTGAIYRAVGYHMYLMGIGPKDKDGIARCLPDVNLELRYVEGVQQVILNGVNVSEEIRLPEMSAMASGVSAQPCVREFLLGMQRDLAKDNNVVMDGRDIGTVVLPKAEVKIFLTAKLEVRAKRRYEELLHKGQKVSYAQVLRDMEQRDDQDTHRAIAPLKQAKDAVLLDASDLTIDECVEKIKAIIANEAKK